MIFHLPFGISASKKYSEVISKEEYRELMAYAAIKGIRMENFKRFAGDISLIKEFIDDISAVAQDFPKLLEGKKSIVIQLDEHASSEDFATTVQHIISINVNLYNNREYLANEYKMLADDGKFVQGTDYRSVARHEVGHVVANIYGISPMQVAEQILGKNADIMKFVKNNISLYAADFADGREFISECFSAYCSGKDIPFAIEYVEKCKKMAEEDDCYEEK